MNVQFKKGALDMCVLALMRHRDRYGYEIVESLAPLISVSEGTIYPLLKRLQTEGLCETYLRESGEGPPRKYYRITRKGLQHIASMLQEWHAFVRAVQHITEKGTKV